MVDLGGRAGPVADEEGIMSLTMSGDAVDGLRAQFSGEVVGPDDGGYDEARAVHNGLIDKRPALIARCANTADVADAVRFARAEGLEISVRGGGHGVAGKAVTEGGVMVDLASMRGSYVDPARRRARVQGGATWNEYNRATHQHGLATTGGVISTTGVAGLTLGGGVGWLMSRFGMAVDNLTSVELVTADGDVLQVSADTDPELFWGVRGGGGNFGIAASLEFEAHPLDTILGGIVAYPLVGGAAGVRRLPGGHRRASRRARQLLRARPRARRLRQQDRRRAGMPQRRHRHWRGARRPAAHGGDAGGRSDRPDAVPGDEHASRRGVPEGCPQLLAVGVLQGALRGGRSAYSSTHSSECPRR